MIGFIGVLEDYIGSCFNVIFLFCERSEKMPDLWFCENAKEGKTKWETTLSMSGMFWLFFFSKQGCKFK